MTTRIRISNAITFNSLTFTDSFGTVFQTAVFGADGISCTIPADGAWHTVTADITNLHADGCDAVFSGKLVLNDIREIELTFTGTGSGTLLLDDFIFGLKDGVALSFPSFPQSLNSLFAVFRIALPRFVYGVYRHIKSLIDSVM